MKKKLEFPEKFSTEVLEPIISRNVIKNFSQLQSKDRLAIIKDLQQEPAVIKAAELIKEGEVVALPTETVYGLAANALNSRAVKKIFAAKGRPQDNPLIIHIARKSALEKLVSNQLDNNLENLLTEFWPGPLTLIFNKKQLVPDQTSAGLKTVAIRMPSHPLFLAVIEKSGFPLAAPSANTSGYPSPTKAEHVFADLHGKIPLILDGGSCEFGLESTVVDLRKKTAVVLRPGALSREKLAAFLGEEVKIAAPGKLPKNKAAIAPGMKYRHYAPEKKLYVLPVDFTGEELASRINLQQVDRIALITARENKIELSSQFKKLTNKIEIKLLKVFNRQQPSELAHKLFDLLRKLDQDSKVEEIYIESVAGTGIAEALMNRIYKAAAAANDFQPGGEND
jgi:L-threonylcarbamoyladenylate synthase